MSHDDYPTDRPAVVTCGLPYANGDLHIGHLRTYVGGDVYSRALDRLGQETAFVSGSDMHGTPVAVNAEQEGVSPEEFALDWHERYAETFPKFNVEFDNYGHTHDETNTELTQDLVRDLDEAGHLYEKEIMVAYDPVDDQYLPDRYVEGTCPYCGAHARGDECDEGCQRHLEPGEVEDPESTITGNPAEYRERTHQFFAVSEFADYLSGFLDRLEGTSNARNQPREWIEQGLQDWCITRDMDWGIDLPDENPQDLVLYVWVDAPIEYIASTKQYSERVGADAFDWEAAWKEGASDEHPEGGEIVHVIGRDIIQHHTIFWPAMLEATDHAEPRAVMASGFVTLDGKGFSTSRDRAVWADEYLDEGFHPDPLRYYLATNGGFQQDVDFSWEKFAERVNTELVGTVGNFLYRSLLFAHRNYEDGPDADAPSDDVAARIDEAVDEFAAAVNDYSVRALGDAVTGLARYGNEYIQRNEPWKLVDEEPAEAERVIYDCVALAKAIAVLFEPLAPEKSERLWAQLGEPGSVHEATVEAAREGPAGDLSEPTELFEQVEDERVEDLNEKLEARVAEAESDDADDESGADDEGDETETTDDTDMSDIEPISDDRIGFEQFQELDIRVGRIEAAEGIEGADDLVELTVDLGAETRTIVAGLKQLHEVDELPDTKVIVLANMEKAELFGVESNGMVLAAGEDADLLTTYEDAAPGTKVK
ncbi:MULTISPECIES: methionine--tRNA ligase [Halorubrum]|uniref:Methionine--tRNA ligase n=1 Tax=Halorubrum tropicale TaxID=1765655 RepID=A0A0N0UAY4_9EURY|nr:MULTISPECIES: methionine--tRNA ligase [Halorubrum]KOX96540.1 methionyl-tRNA synthetase [Halorubrum tropicale]TKX44212.1 methionine--tRNA ligase [Halorubrum sp. ARQ200]TKX50880.1 methionine--tRNA ligase [Halorubrum sp. ASP121]TKX63546.1 methionine--tRNA ligase [Halorubrum sp. ASP1]